MSIFLEILFILAACYFLLDGFFANPENIMHQIYQQFHFLIGWMLLGFAFVFDLLRQFLKNQKEVKKILLEQVAEIPQKTEN